MRAKLFSIPVVFFIILLGQSSFLFGQGNRGTVSITATGSIVSEETGNPLEYATVSFHRPSDSSLITGGVTDFTGNFSIDVSSGEFFVKASFLGYGEKSTSVYQVPKGESNISIGRIALAPAATSLDEVKVEARKSTMELKLDKRVFNVGTDLSNTGANGLQVLENVPSVEVGIDGGVSLRGSDNVRILIDGKPSGLTGISSSEALRFLQGDQIEKIEVVTNPSARYDAEGDVGIINIILKKEKKKGLNGSLTGIVGYPHNYGFSGNMNYRKGKVNFFSSYSFQYQKRPGNGYFYQESYDPDTIIYERLRDHERGGFGNTVRAGVDIQLNDMNTLTFTGMFNDGQGENLATNTYRDFNLDGSLASVSTRVDDEEEDERNYEFEITHQKSFKDKGRSWTTTGKYISSLDNESSDIVEGNDLNPLDTIYQRVFNDENQARWLFQTDYIHPFKERFQFETGARVNLRKINNNYLVEQLENENWEVVRNLKDSLVYKENVLAGYAMIGHQLDKFSWQAGLRAEYTIIETQATSDGSQNKKNYLDLFPSVHLAYDFGKGNTLQFSYSRRLSRPGFRQLLPFSSFSDSRSLWIGNPDLNPEYTHSLEIGYLKDWEKGSILISPYYRYSTGVIERVLVVDSLGNSYGIAINLSDEHSGGFEINYSQDLFEWWSLNMNLNIYYSITNGEYEGQDLSAKTWSGNSRLMSRFTMPWDMDLQLSANLRAPRNTTQGFQKGIYSMDIGLSQKLLNGSGVLSFNVSDVFNTRRRRSELNQPNFYRLDEFQWRARQFTLSFSYYFNQQPRPDRGMGSGGGGEF